MSDFKQRPDSGRLMAVDSKRSEKAPDYWGEIAIDMKNATNVRVVDGLHIFRINGWKKRSQNGKTFLSISIDRYERDQKVQKPATREEDEDFDF